MHEKPIAAGKSSFDLIDAKKVFASLALKPGSTFLDIACGAGKYSLAAADLIGKTGLIYAIDLWDEGIAILEKEIAARNLDNIKAILGDVSKSIPVGNDSIDVCLMATVLHDLIEVKADHGALMETARIVKAGGTLAVIEFKKIEPPPGPPVKIRLSPEELRAIVEPYGFAFQQIIDAGPYNYVALFSKQ